MNKRMNNSRKMNKYLKDKYMMEDCKPSNNTRKPVIYSCDDVNRMAVESTRARLISEVFGNQEELHPKEFGSYFLGPTREFDPPVSITSHAVSTNLKQKPVIPAYPSVVQGLRWNPYVETSSVDTSQTDFVEKKKFHCKCENWCTRNCPSRISSSSTIRPSIFRDNIMTFRDRCTMTPVKNDIGCGGPSTSCITRMSDVSITTPTYNVKDTHVVDHLYTPQRGVPSPILKRNEYNECDFNNSHRENNKEKTTRYNSHEEAERDTDVTHDHREPDKSRSKLTFKLHKQKCDSQRKNIYNEGISDRIANRFPIKPISLPCPVNLKKDCSRISVMSKCFVDKDKQIPYSHKSNSKYHHHCKTSQSNLNCDSDGEEMRHLLASPLIVRKAYKNKNARYNKVCINMPKKVLASERDIESYIESNYQKVYIPDARRK